MMPYEMSGAGIEALKDKFVGETGLVVQTSIWGGNSHSVVNRAFMQDTHLSYFDALEDQLRAVAPAAGMDNVSRVTVYNKSSLQPGRLDAEIQLPHHGS